MKVRLNISHDALMDIVTRYEIAPGVCSHLRGQEQLFSARTTKDDKNEDTAVGKARAKIVSCLGRLNLV